MERGKGMSEDRANLLGLGTATFGGRAARERRPEWGVTW
jgi:hypothetical protein